MADCTPAGVTKPHSEHHSFCSAACGLTKLLITQLSAIVAVDPEALSELGACLNALSDTICYHFACMVTDSFSPAHAHVLSESQV